MVVFFVKIVFILSCLRGSYFFFIEGDEGDVVWNMMENVVNSFCEYLRKNFCLFQDCYLFKIGSIYEGVKIGKFDEFDFMIEVLVFVLSDVVVF